MLLMLLTTLRVGPVEGNCIKKKYVYLYIYWLHSCPSYVLKMVA